jgi:hypothetical protein
MRSWVKKLVLGIALGVMSSSISAQYKIIEGEKRPGTNKSQRMIVSTIENSNSPIAMLDTVSELPRNSDFLIVNDALYILYAAIYGSEFYLNFEVFSIEENGLRKLEHFYEKIELNRNHFFNTLSWEIIDNEIVVTAGRFRQGHLNQSLFYDLVYYEAHEFKYFMKLVRRMFRQKIPKALREVSQQTILDLL